MLLLFYFYLLEFEAIRFLCHIYSILCVCVYVLSSRCTVQNKCSCSIEQIQYYVNSKAKNKQRTNERIVKNRRLQMKWKAKDTTELKKNREK